MKRHIFSLIVLLLLSFGAIRPLLARFFPMHDDTQVGRVIVMGKRYGTAISGSMGIGFRVGYGYPLFSYYGPLPYYVGGFCMRWDCRLEATR
jgi:hypothetical protein